MVSVLLHGPSAVHAEYLLHCNISFIFLVRLRSETSTCPSRAWTSHVLHCTSLAAAKLGWERAGLNQSITLVSEVTNRSLDKDLGVL